MTLKNRNRKNRKCGKYLLILSTHIYIFFSNFFIVCSSYLCFYIYVRFKNIGK